MFLPSNLFAVTSLFSLVTCGKVKANSEDGGITTKSLHLHATAFQESPNDYGFYGIGGINYDKSQNLWVGIHEGNPGAGLQKKIESPRMYTFQPNWVLEGAKKEKSDGNDIEVILSEEINPPDGLKCEGIAKVPSSSQCDANATDFFLDPEYWVISESNSNTELTKSYFTKRFGHPDLNTYVPGTLRDSRFIRVSSTGNILEEIELPPWMLWDGKFNWDPWKCYGTRVLKGLHAMTLYDLNNTANDDAVTHQLIMMSQTALYQDGPEPTIFDGSHMRIMYWDVKSHSDASCSVSISYSRSYRYETSRLLIDTFQKGARHVRGVFGILAITPTEFLVTETELLEGVGIAKFISDVFYVKIESTEDTVDHCSSLLDSDCADIPIPKKRHLLRREHPYELSDLAWGEKVEKNGAMYPTIAMSFENDDVVGILMELYIFNATNLEVEPLWENNSDSSRFVRNRVAVLSIASTIFALGIIFQYWWTNKKLKEQSTVDGSINDDKHNPDSKNTTGFGYRDYILASAIVNSTMLGGIVFGFPGLVLILRREGIFADVCSCGVFCAGQQEKLSMISTMGFGAAIGSRLFAGIFLDRFGPKITSVCSGVLSTVGLLLIATAKDSSELTNRITGSWIVLAVGGSAMHLTSFHITNLQASVVEKRKASLYVSAGFGAGSLILPILQVINQYGNVRFQTICVYYSCLSILLTLNGFLVQPWRAWNSIGSSCEKSWNILDPSWWPCGDEATLTASKKPSDTKFPTLKEALTSFTFWGECYWFSCQLFLLTYYLSTINQILFSLGDAKVEQDVDSLLNNMFTRASIFFNGLGFLWSPIVGYLMKTKTIYFRVYLEIAMSLVMSILLTLPIIEVQVIVFLLQALVRLQVFSNHFAYIAERFGFRHFGLLNGISSLIAGAFGLLGYPLQIFSVFIAAGNFGVSYFIVAGLLITTGIFPFVLKRKDALTKESEASNVIKDIEKS